MKKQLYVPNRARNPDDLAHIRTKRREWQRRYRQRYPEIGKAQTARYRARHSELILEKRHGWHLQRRYGITPEVYDRLLQRQHGCCAICHRPSSDFKRRLDVDHSHITGKVRALLCSPCNVLIGMAGEDIMRLYAVIDYLKQHEKEK